MRRKFFRVSIFALILFTFVPSALASFSIKPAFGDGYTHNSTSNGIFVYTVDPGEVIQTGVNLINVSNEAISLGFSALDGTYNESGAFVVSSFNEDQEGVGKWTMFKDSNQKNSFPLGPKQTIEVPISISVPENLAPGSYFGSFQVYPAVVDSNESSDSGTGAAVTTRVGKIVQINVRGEEVVDYAWSTFEKGAVTEEGTHLVEIAVQNQGNVVIDVVADLKVTDVFGKEVFATKAEFAALPGTKKETPVYFDNLPKIGLFKVVADASFTPKSYITETEPEVSKESRTLSFMILPLIPFVICLSILILFVALIALKVRKTKHFKENCVSYKVKKGDNLMELAQKHNADWKMIAKVNKIKSPYFIAASQVILLPKKK